MNINERIKKRRKELNLSAEAIAEIIGVSPATIYRYESADIMNMGIDKLLPLADALNTTAAYLITGENPSISEISKDSSNNLCKNEQQLLDLFRNCNKEEQDKILDYTRGLLEYRKLKQLLSISEKEAHTPTKQTSLK
ncbi:MAG: helix-turn-helix domain-containing protein [Aminipila sp.]